MPALLTHYLCGNSTLKLIENDNLTDTISGHRNAFNLGTQGPDIFFYYGAWPWVDSKAINSFGDRMHEEKTGEFIIEIIKYIDCTPKHERNTLIAYICGYLCHYALDCHTHPYIFYRSGFVRKNEPYTNKYTCYHRMFETALDVLMLSREMALKPPAFRAADQIRVDASTAGAISSMLAECLKKVYSANISHELAAKAIADMASISSMLRDSTGLKKKLLYRLEKLLGKYPMFSSMILPLELGDGLDYLNLSHSVWQLPWDKDSCSTASFLESFEAAAEETKEFVYALQDLLNGKTSMDKLSTIAGNRSFSTGLDCRLDLEFKYFDCIFE